MSMKMLLKFFLALCALWTGANAILVHDLGGNSWTATNSNKSIKVPAIVPGSIYSDLIRSKHIEDPLHEYNDQKTRWVSYDSWTFERSFDVDAAVLAKAHIYLTAHGLDTIGRVTVNGRPLGAVDNMFVRWRFPVKELLKEKDNLIQVHFESAPLAAKAIQEKMKNEKYVIPPLCPPKEYQGECAPQLLRKMQASFSWDWGPAVPTAGIWKPLQIEAFDNLVVRTISVETVSSDLKDWTLKYTVHVDGVADSSASGNLELLLGSEVLDTQKVDVKFDAQGEAKVEHSIQVPAKFAVKPWYPNGSGAQQLYNLTAKITSSHKEVSEKRVKIGFRTLKLVQEKLQDKSTEKGTAEAYSFYFSVNSEPIYAKGSNWIPADVLHERLTDQYIRQLLRTAQLSNMNMLRVWGGGIYEDNRFYEIADEFGILIWQDFMFACAAYPTDQHFLDSVSAELRQNVRRMQHHPSIALWAGNNENEAALADGWWPETINGQPHREDYRNDYRTLYIKTIKPLIESEDPSRAFLPSSPSNGIKSPEENFIGSRPSSTQYGDMHFYIFAGDVWEYKLYPSAKFVSEYGFQSWASIQTLATAISKDHLKYPLDEMMKYREHKPEPEGLSALDSMIGQDLKLPIKGGNVSNLVDYIYLSQVHQAVAIKSETEFYRRNRAINSEGEGHTMGALYWQLNDVWPTVSWSSMDYGGRWRMLQYFAQDFFENTLVHAYEELKKSETTGELKVVVIRDDHKQASKMVVQIDVFDWSALKPIHSHKVEVETKPFDVTLAFTENLDKFLADAKCKARVNCFIEVSASKNGKIVSRNFLFVEKPKNAVGLQKAKITVKSVSGPKTTTHGHESFDLVLETDALAPFVWLDFVPESQIGGIFSDNGFMFTQSNVSLSFVTEQKVTLDQFKKELVIKSLHDVVV